MTKSYLDLVVELGNDCKPAKHNPNPGSLCFHGNVATVEDLPTKGDWGDGCAFFVDNPGDNYFYNNGQWGLFSWPNVKPHYSGPDSTAFWAQVNRLHEPDNAVLYALGVALQNLEGFVLKALHDAQQPVPSSKGDKP